MKLYEIPKNSTILLPITDGTTTETKACMFHHIDGMYSYITTPEGDVVHLSVSAEVERKDGVWQLSGEGTESEDERDRTLNHKHIVEHGGTPD